MFQQRKEQQRNKKLSDKKQPPQTEEHWQEIFDSIDMETLPVAYMNKVIVRFHDKTIWHIDIKDTAKKQPIEDIETSLDEMFNLYQDSIESIDFRMDMDRVKADLSKRVKKFLKLNK